MNAENIKILFFFLNLWKSNELMKNSLQKEYTIKCRGWMLPTVFFFKTVSLQARLYSH